MGYEIIKNEPWIITFLRQMNDHYLESKEIYNLEKELPAKIVQEPIHSITLIKYPVKVVQIIDCLTSGKFLEECRAQGYANLYSTFFFINQSYILFKGHFPRMKKIRHGLRFDPEAISFALPTTVLRKKNLTIGGFIENTRKYMGERSFISYSYTTETCQQFMMAALRANQLDTVIDETWIEQKNIRDIVQNWLTAVLRSALEGILSQSTIVFPQNNRPTFTPSDI